MLKIFDNYYGRIKRSYNWDGKVATEKDEIPLGFITYVENNKEFDKRKSTIDKWADLKYCYGNYHNRGNEDYTDHTEYRFINDFVKGFRLGQEIKRVGWNGGNVVWRVEDPRGFQIEIPCSNLARIIDYCGLEPGGIISLACKYGRDSAQNILLPFGCDAIKELEQEKAVPKKTYLSMKELKNGMYIKYSKDDYHETSEVFVGRVKLFMTDETSEFHGRTVFVTYDKTRYFERQGREPSEHLHFNVTASLKINKDTVPDKPGVDVGSMRSLFNKLWGVTEKDLYTFRRFNMGIMSPYNSGTNKNREQYSFTSWDLRSKYGDVVNLDRFTVNPESDREGAWTYCSLKLDLLQVKEVKWVD